MTYTGIRKAKTFQKRVKRKEDPSKRKEKASERKDASAACPPAKAAIQAELAFWRGGSVDSGFIGNDGSANDNRGNDNCGARAFLRKAVPSPAAEAAGSLL
jgi:hypothetical protein